MENRPNNLFALPFEQCQVGWLTNSHTGWVKPALCKSWRCGYCGPRKQRQWVRRITRRAIKGYFVTLTVDRGGELLAENIRRLNRCWRTLKQWFKRNAGLRNFSWTNESGSKNGRIHKHAVIECDGLDYREARAAVVRAGFGAVCDFQRIRFGSRGAHAYLSKYLAKNLADGEWPRYARRCQTTHPADPPEPGWTFEKKKLPPIVNEHQEIRANHSIDSMLLAQNLQLALEAQKWTPQLELPLALTTEEKVHHTTEGWNDEQADEGSSRGPPDSS